MGKRRVLVLCTGNSCRSQMAEGWIRHELGDAVAAFSAGTSPSPLHPTAVRVMAEAGVDITAQRSKPVSEFLDQRFDLVVTVCDDARDACPVFPGATVAVHEPFPDPARFRGPEDEVVERFREVRDEIRERIVPLVRRALPLPSREEGAMENEAVRKSVREHYAAIARADGGCCAGAPAASCCGAADARAVSTIIGYSEKEMAAVPEGANLGLGCGNPLAFAALKPGDVVVDLGSGAGFDCFIAAARVGATGRVIGVDMTPEMIERARANAATSGAATVEFRLGEIEHLPVADAAADMVISNCVINLSTDKPQVFREALRVLKPGGTLMVSDLVLRRPLPASVRRSVEAYAGCIAGAMLRDDYLAAIRTAGFTDVTVAAESSYEIGLSDPDATETAVLGDVTIPAADLRAAADAVVSVKVRARKP